MDLTQPLNDLKSGQTVVFWDKAERYGSINPEGGITICQGTTKKSMARDPS